MSEMVYPVKVDGTAIAHLATADVDGAGAQFRPICPAGPLITRPLRLIRVDEQLVWCGACKAWANAAGVVLPTGAAPGAASTGPPADG